VHFKKFLNSLDQLELEKAASKELSWNNTIKSQKGRSA
jgi:hypothetical protein